MHLHRWRLRCPCLPRRPDLRIATLGLVWHSSPVLQVALRSHNGKLALACGVSQQDGRLACVTDECLSGFPVALTGLISHELRARATCVVCRLGDTRHVEPLCRAQPLQFSALLLSAAVSLHLLYWRPLVISVFSVPKPGKR